MSIVNCARGQGYFVDAPQMTAAFEAGGEEFIHDGISLGFGDKAARQSQDVGIIVTAGEVGYLRHPTESTAYALMFVEGHADAFARAANSYAQVHLPGFDCASQGVGIVGIVTA